jgi:hypothetical protein
MPARSLPFGFFTWILLGGGQTTHKLPEALPMLDPKTHSVVFELEHHPVPALQTQPIPHIFGNR